MPLIPVTLSRREDMIMSKPRFNDLIESLKQEEITAKSIYGEKQVSLAPDDIAGLSFWTKDPTHFVQYFLSSEGEELFSKYQRRGNYILELQVSITGFGGTEVEPGIPAPEEVCKQIILLVKESDLPAINITWRFDPIILNETYSLAWAESRYCRISEALRGLGIKRNIFSFMDSYHGSTPNIAARFNTAGLRMPEEFPPGDRAPGTISTPEQYEKSQHKLMLEFMVQRAEDTGFQLYCCRDGYDNQNEVLKDYDELRNIHRAGCTDKEWYEIIWGGKISGSKSKIAGKYCGCTRSIDGGRSDICCPGRCIYCYADKSGQTQ